MALPWISLSWDALQNSLNFLMSNAFIQNNCSGAEKLINNKTSWGLKFDLRSFHLFLFSGQFCWLPIHGLAADRLLASVCQQHVTGSHRWVCQPSGQQKAVELGLEGTTERSGNASAMHCISSQASQSLAVKSLWGISSVLHATKPVWHYLILVQWWCDQSEIPSWQIFPSLPCNSWYRFESSNWMIDWKKLQKGSWTNCLAWTFGGIEANSDLQAFEARFQWGRLNK